MTSSSQGRKGVYSQKERLANGVTFALFVETPITIGAFYLAYSLFQASSRNFDTANLDALFSFPVVCYSGIALFGMVTTPLRIFWLACFLLGERPAANYSRYLALLLLLSVPIMALMTYQSAGEFSIGAMKDSALSQFYLLFPLLLLIGALIDARQRSYAERGLLSVESPAALEIAPSGRKFTAYRVLSDGERRAIGTSHEEQVLALKTVGFTSLGICEESTAPLLALALPIAAIQIKLKERSKIDALLRLKTYYPILVSQSGDTVATITRIGIRFTSFLSDGWRVVTVTSKEPSMVDHKKRMMVTQVKQSAADAWRAHQETLCDFGKQGRGAITGNLWDHYRAYGEQSLRLQDIVLGGAISWGLIILFGSQLLRGYY
ncbi:MAG: hypothetical protein J5J00_08975 [Deltaproteobacteria bacterium]|nr:hypothetical protein [Deltaproteobacteria bacterium]